MKGNRGRWALVWGLLLFALVLVSLLWHFQMVLMPRYRVDLKLALAIETVGILSSTAVLGCVVWRTQARLTREDALRREAVASLSHDLRTPLALIAGYAEAMRDLPGEVTPENLQVIIDESGRLTRMVGDALLLPQFRTPLGDLNAKSFDLGATARDALDRYHKLTGGGQGAILYHGPEHLSVRGDPVKLSRVLDNLLGNALDHSPPGQPVTLMLIPGLTVARVSVSDRGAGIPPERLERIWDLYYSHRDGAPHSGLGLPIVKAVLELHGAPYGVESRPGQGANFWFDLPLA